MVQYKYGVYLLTCVCGMVDVVCFLGLNGVFAEMMTGNLLMIAISIGTARFWWGFLPRRWAFTAR